MREHSRTPLFWVITFAVAIASGVVVNYINGTSAKDSSGKKNETQNNQPVMLTEKRENVIHPAVENVENKRMVNSVERDEVKNTVIAWIGCTENKDYDCFKSYLSENYTYESADGLHRTYATRLSKLVQIFEENNNIVIRYSDIIVTEMGENKMKAHYYQKYQSDKHSDSGYKTLYLLKSDNSWKIVREEFSVTPE